MDGERDAVGFPLLVELEPLIVAPLHLCARLWERERERERGKGEGELNAQSIYSGTSDKGPSEIGTASLQRTLVSTPC